MSQLRCPICSAPLTRTGRTYRCPSGHSFDISKEGYVHLLPANRMHSKAPGDDKGMAAARNRFLSGGWYAPLRDALCDLALKHAGPAPQVLDSGCGEGYYTAGLWQALTEAGRSVSMAGIDISKFSLRWAAKRAPEVEFAVASAYRLPVAGQSVDLLVNCFSPLGLEEFRRVLRPGGWFFYVVPAPEHLWELKTVLYEEPYPNPEESIPYDGFRCEEVRPVEACLSLTGPEVIHDLFQMTPYYWKTPKSGAERLAGLERLEVRAAFRIHVFQRE
ncbi:MAG: methyltransferase domain-containing protein [Oscillospiraceae bacterium]|nr:methyltransferase domain-containing protein [Oscillospiraceae bacterium]